MKYIITCPGCKKRISFDGVLPFGKRATCKKCAAEFFLDPTVVTEVPDLASEMIRSAEAKSTIQLEEKPPNEPVAEVAPAREESSPTKIFWGLIIVVINVMALSILVALFLTYSTPTAKQNPKVVVQDPPLQQRAPTNQRVEESVKRSLGTGDLFVLKLFKTSNLELELLSIDENTRAYKTASKVYVTCDGNAEDLKMLGIRANVDDLLYLMKDDNGKDRAPIAEDFVTAMRLCVLAVRPSLADEISESFASNYGKTMLEKSRHFIEKPGLKVVFGFSPNDTDSNYFFVIGPN